MRIRSSRNKTGWSRNSKRHFYDKKRPYNDQRYRPVHAALIVVFPLDVADKLMAEYQREPTKRHSIYAMALEAADAQWKRGPERATIKLLITAAHHACFNLKEI